MVGSRASPIVYLSSRERQVVGVPCSVCFTPKKTAPHIHWIHEWVGPRIIQDVVMKIKFPPDSNDAITSKQINSKTTGEAAFHHNVPQM
jgi:hypothetical protein